MQKTSTSMAPPPAPPRGRRPDDADGAGASSSVPPPPPPAYNLRRKFLMCLSLLLTIWFVGDPRRNFSAVSALKYHEPSQRVFRALLQVNLVLWCAALSIFAWRTIVEDAVVAKLLFGPVEVLASSYSTVTTATAAYDDGGDGHGHDHDRRRETTIVFHDNDGRDQHRDGEGGGESGGAAEETKADAAAARNAAARAGGGVSSRSQCSDEDICLDDVDDLDAHYESDGEVEDPDEAIRERIPPVASVASAAFDTLLVILVALFLFTMSASGYYRTADDYWKFFSQVAAPSFPLLLFVYLSVVAFLPWRRRSDFWILIAVTVNAPWPAVTFRDGFIGDVLTSTVRPLQDIAFTVFYLLSGLRGWWSTKYFDSQTFIDHADDSVPKMEKSWLLHTVVLPMCMVSPLWWRFLQNLRQCYDNKQRWPYLGNALKYFVAAQVAVFGVYHPELQKTAVWLASFVVATLYQIWWDIFMDWGLFERNRKTGRWQLRRRRLYPNKCMYWSICTVNVVLRFCWTLSFLPPRYLNPAGVLQEGFEGNFEFFLGPTIASAEIIRRTLWGLLRFEWEAVKDMSDEEDEYDRKPYEKESDHPRPVRDLELKPMELSTGDEDSSPMKPFGPQRLTSDMSTMNNAQILGELSLYATTFALIGALAAAHRGTF